MQETEAQPPRLHLVPECLHAPRVAVGVRQQLTAAGEWGKPASRQGEALAWGWCWQRLSRLPPAGRLSSSRPGLFAELSCYFAQWRKNGSGDRACLQQNKAATLATAAQDPAPAHASQPHLHHPPTKTRPGPTTSHPQSFLFT